MAAFAAMYSLPHTPFMACGHAIVFLLLESLFSAIAVISGLFHAREIRMQKVLDKAGKNWYDLLRFYERGIQKI